MGRRRNKKASLGIESELFEIDHSLEFGRFLKAKVDLKQGDWIIKEGSLVSGPRLGSKWVCIGCHSSLGHKKTESLKCSKCSWPICSSKCEAATFHSTECSFLSKRSIKPPGKSEDFDFGVIYVLRALLLKLNRPSDWRKFLLLEHHNEIRKDYPVWTSNGKIVEILRRDWNLGADFNEDEIRTVCGIIEVNSFEVGDGYSFGGIFVGPSLMAHSCLPNASFTENTSDCSLEVRAILDIPAGSSITLCYGGTLIGTVGRQRILERSKYFTCSCERCQDPLELGTHFSTLMCQSCKKGLVTQSRDVSKEWKCSKCSKKYSQHEIEEVHRKFTDEAEACSSIESKEAFLKRGPPIFHQNHYIPLGVKFSLCMLYGHEEGYTINELTLGQAHRKLDLCNQVMKVLNVITPGWTVSRGNILYEIQACDVLISRSLVESSKCSKALMKRRLGNTVKTLTEAMTIFELYHPLKLLAEHARNTTMAELQVWMKSLKLN